MITGISIAIAVISLILAVQAFFSAQLMLYSWEDTSRLALSKPPSHLAPPKYSFSILLPARDEEKVIGHTIAQIWNTDYPNVLKEIFVICHVSDELTIQAAQQALNDIGSPRNRVLTFSDSPINKPHGLNVGLRQSTHDFITVFDSEDDVSPDLFRVVNTILIEEGVNIVQGGVQLMNFRDHWFSAHNCLEYFYWFKSRLHFQAAKQIVPLGGNTVFFSRQLLEQVGGWNEHCLTEDAEIGLQLSALGEPIRVFYDTHLSTREETPESIGQFIKQRTRWHQGFLQILFRGTWRKLPGFQQRMLAIYIFSYPWFLAAILLVTPVMILAGILIKLSVWIAILSFIPLYGLICQAFLSVYGLIAFAREYKLRYSLWDLIVLIITFIPYQLLQGVSALRATWRELMGKSDWEKTSHAGAHRA